MTAKRGASQGYDLDAARAARREAAGEGFEFTFGGKPYKCLPAKEWPIQVLGLLSEGDLLGSLTLVLGQEQFDQFMTNEPTSGDVEDLMNALGEFTGVDDAGNSKAQR